MSEVKELFDSCMQLQEDLDKLGERIAKLEGQLDMLEENINRIYEMMKGEQKAVKV